MRKLGILFVGAFSMTLGAFGCAKAGPLPQAPTASSADGQASGAMTDEQLAATDGAADATGAGTAAGGKEPADRNARRNGTWIGAAAEGDLLSSTTTLRDHLMSNAMRFRTGMMKAGFSIKEGVTPIVPVMLGDARLAGDLAKGLLDEGIYVIGFSFPVVPKGEARIRVQLSAQHTEEQVDRAITAFATVGKRLGVIKS